ncbi:MAG: hybrid sensor histidine kinase/response regulator [Steroidobacteraceae bacterium]
MIIPLDPKTPQSRNGPNGDGDSQTSQTMLRAIVRDVQDHAVFLLDADGRIRSWSSGAQTLTGYAAAEVLGEPFAMLFPAEESERAVRTLGSARAQERCEDEGWQVRRDGSRSWTSFAVTALQTEGGEFGGYLAISRDLSERLSRERALKESEERFRMLVEGVRDYAIFTLDPGGCVRSWNAGARQIKGYEAHEIIGSHFSRFYPPEAIGRGGPDHALRIAAIEGRFEDEGWRLRKDGTRFWANAIITALRDESGELKGFTKITRDLSERRRREEQLRESEQRFRLLVESGHDHALFMLDNRGFVSSWNAGAERIEGYRTEEIVGRHFSNFYRAEDVSVDRPWHELAAARRAGLAELEGWRVRKDGTVFWAKVVLSVIVDGQGELVGFAHVTRDLTQQRHTEALENAAARMNEFIAMLAHELRNPLAPIRNAVMLMQKRGLGDTVLESMRVTIDRQSRNLERIVSELLDASRVARGELLLDEHSLDLRETIERAIETTCPAVERGKHELHVSMPGEPVRIVADELRLGQAFVNLLNNAAKYMAPHGHIWLTVERRRSEIAISVRDSGVGIRPEMLSRVFELFVQDRETLERSGGGLGVGLALVRRIVELHGGRVEARSEGRGRGSEFLVHLPAAPEAGGGETIGPAAAACAAPTASGAAASGEAARPDASLAEAAAELPRRRVLIVDDNADAAQALDSLLTSMGQETAVVYDGFAALEAVARFHPDLVLLDVGMPQLDGYEVARRLRSPPGGQRLTLAAVTGWGQNADRRRAHEAGFDRHCAKPLSEASLRELILGAHSARAKRSRVPAE